MQINESKDRRKTNKWKMSNIGRTDGKEKKKITAVPQADVQGLHHPAQSNLGYFLARFQSPQLLTALSESFLGPKSHADIKLFTQL
jgi:hypothetical protein